MLIRGPGAGSPIGTHAFIIGVSHYPHADGDQPSDFGSETGIENLSGVAKSASDVAAWLLNEYNQPDAPLASLRILLSPVEGEQINPDIATRMQGQTAPAVRRAVEDEFAAFRRDCRSNTENVAFVYIAGHGWQLTSRGAIVLLHDFATPDHEDEPLFGAIDVVGCHDALDEMGSAHHQLWLSDACRQRPEFAKRFDILGGAYKPNAVRRIGVESSPLLLAASNRQDAYATVNGTTIFCQALLSGLRGNAGTAPSDSCDDWHVTSGNLSEHLDRQTRALLAGQAEQRVDPQGTSRNFVLHRLREVPGVEIEVSLDPTSAHEGADAALYLGGDPCTIERAWPLRYVGAAGIYALDVNVTPPYKRKVLPINANPPREACVVRVD